MEEESLKQQLESIESERRHLASQLDDEQSATQHLDAEEERFDYFFSHFILNL